ncbi:MAG: sensor histidine kinase [Bacteroidota bacterium]
MSLPTRLPLLLIISCLCGSFSPVAAQSPVLDSLQQAWSQASTDTGKLRLHLAMAKEWWAEADWEKSALQLAAARHLAEKLDDPYWWGEVSFHEGLAAQEANDRPAIRAYFDQAMQHFSQAGDQEKEMSVLSELAQLNYYEGSYDASILNFHRLYAYYADIRDTMEMTWALNFISGNYEAKGINDSAMAYGYRARDLVRAIDAPIDLASSLNNIGFAYMEQGIYDSALQYFRAAIPLCRKAKRPDGEAIFMQNIGIVQSRAGQFVASLQSYLRSMFLYDSIAAYSQVADLKTNIGIIHKRHGQYAEAIDYYQEALAFDLSEADTSGLIAQYNNIGSAYLEAGRLDSARKYALMSYRLVEASDHSCFDGEAGLLGKYYYEAGKLDSARHYTQQEVEAVKKCGNRTFLPMSAYVMGRIYQDQGQAQQARYWFEQSYASAKETGRLEAQAEAAQALYASYKSAGQTEKALGFLEIYQWTSDSVFNQNNTRQLAWMEATYQMDRVADSLQAVQEQEALAFEQEISQQRRRIGQILLGGLVLGVLTGIYFFYLRKRRKLEMEKTLLEEKNHRYQAVIEATEEERHRIAKDLHDGVVQQMGAIQLGLRRLMEAEKTPPQALEEIHQLSINTAQETRQLSHQMMPRALMEMGLVPALREVADGMLNRAGMEVAFEEFGLQERYEMSVEIALYRIFQELVQNILRHAEARSVSVQLYQTGGQLHLMVEDDGIGISPAPERGLGLENIVSRAEVLGGTATIEPGPQQGTVAQISIPI